MTEKTTEDYKQELSKVRKQLREATAVDSNETRRLIIYRMLRGNKTERLRLTIPSNAKVTFGKLQPTPGYSDTNNFGQVLRIYRTENQQLACITNVISFRDEALLFEKLQLVDDEAQWVSDNGMDITEDIGKALAGPDDLYSS